jgi:hypothetical protein
VYKTTFRLQFKTSQSSNSRTLSHLGYKNPQLGYIRPIASVDLCGIKIKNYGGEK